MMFGPHDSDSPNTNNAVKWKIKRESNDVLRQKFIDKTIPQAELIGLKIPDNDIKWNEAAEHYEYGKINWEEFHRVINGHGACNKQRMDHHLKYHEEGQWVREAAEAHKNKKKLVEAI